MIVKKNYGDDYIIMKLTNIEFRDDNKTTLLIGELIDEKGCGDFREFNELCLIMDRNVEVIEQ